MREEEGFGANEGRRGAVVVREPGAGPLLMFEVNEGRRGVWHHQRTRNTPLAHVWGEQGGRRGLSLSQNQKHDPCLCLRQMRGGEGIGIVRNQHALTCIWGKRGGEEGAVIITEAEA